jgi:tetratricopeptide (TPR) repeat protein
LALSSRAKPNLITLLASLLGRTELWAIAFRKEAITVYDELIARFTTCTELSLLEPLATALLSKRIALGSLERLEEAIAIYDELITRFADRTELTLLEPLANALFNKRVTLGSFGRSEETEQSVRRSLDIVPTMW